MSSVKKLAFEICVLWLRGNGTTDVIYEFINDKERSTILDYNLNYIFFSIRAILTFPSQSLRNQKSFLLIMLEV